MPQGWDLQAAYYGMMGGKFRESVMQSPEHRILNPQQARRAIITTTNTVSMLPSLTAMGMPPTIIQRDLFITATQTNTVNGIDISDINVLAYNLTFNVMYTYADGSTSILFPLTPSKPIIMFENKDHQANTQGISVDGKEVDKRANAFKDNAFYKLKWGDYKGRNSLFIETTTHKISDAVVIHPTWNSKYLAGCKSLMYESDATTDIMKLKNSTLVSLKPDCSGKCALDKSQAAFSEIYFKMSLVNIYGIMDNIYLHIKK